MITINPLRILFWYAMAFKTLVHSFLGFFMASLLMTIYFAALTYLGDGSNLARVFCAIVSGGMLIAARAALYTRWFDGLALLKIWKRNWRVLLALVLVDYVGIVCTSACVAIFFGADTGWSFLMGTMTSVDSTSLEWTMHLTSAFCDTALILVAPFLLFDEMQLGEALRVNFAILRAAPGSFILAALISAAISVACGDHLLLIVMIPIPLTFALQAVIYENIRQTRIVIGQSAVSIAP
jgi:hypothetical protein